MWERREKSNPGRGGPILLVLPLVIVAITGGGTVMSGDGYAVAEVVFTVARCSWSGIEPVPYAEVVISRRVSPPGMANTAPVSTFTANMVGRVTLSVSSAGVYDIVARHPALGSRSYAVFLSGRRDQLLLPIGRMGAMLRPSHSYIEVVETVALTPTAKFCKFGMTPPPGIPGWTNPTWESANPGIAEVTSEGVVSGISVGWTLIQARSGAAFASAFVTVGPFEGDEIELLNNDVLYAGSDLGPETAVLVDARNGTADPADCRNDVVRDASSLRFYNLGNPAGTILTEHCAPTDWDEIAVFSMDDAAVLDVGDGESGNIWTDARGEVRQVALDEPLRPVPVVLWIAKEKKTSTGEDVRNLAIEDVENASMWYNESRMGVVFSKEGPNEVFDDVGAVSAIGDGCNAAVKGTCQSNGTPCYEPGKVNVYYVKSISVASVTGSINPKGFHCGWLDPNIIYVSVLDRSQTTLAHELGHAFGLEHTCASNMGVPFYDDAEVPEENMMSACGPPLDWGVAPDGRRTFTLGQAFRANFDARSLMHRNRIWLDRARTCECTLFTKHCMPTPVFKSNTAANRICPAVPLDWF